MPNRRRLSCPSSWHLVRRPSCTQRPPSTPPMACGCTEESAAPTKAPACLKQAITNVIQAWTPNGKTLQYFNCETINIKQQTKHLQNLIKNYKHKTETKHLQNRIKSNTCEQVMITLLLYKVLNMQNKDIENQITNDISNENITIHIT